MLKRDVSLAEDLTRLKICAQEPLSVKVKRQIGSNGYLYLRLKITVRVFPPIKLKKSPPLDYHHTVERGETEPPEFNEGALRISKHQKRVLDR